MIRFLSVDLGLSPHTLYHKVYLLNVASHHTPISSLQRTFTNKAKSEGLIVSSG